MDKFEEALQQHKDNLTKNLAEFGEGHRLNRMHKEIDINAADYEYYFQAGQQSQQAKVEELQKRVDEALKIISQESEEIDLAEYRINGAFVDAKKVEQALKGESDGQ